MQAAVDAVAQAWGRIDILANIAGITQPVKVANTTPEGWDRITGVNLKGTFLFSKAVAAVMARHKYGRIST